MNHKIGKAIFVTVFSLGAAWLSYQWVTDPSGRLEREAQERAVLAAREALYSATGLESVSLVDPLSPQRKVGKVYVFRTDSGWEVSGYYQRADSKRWYPWLMSLDGDLSLQQLRVSDPALAERAAADPGLLLEP